MTSLLRKKGKGKEKAQSSEAPRFKSPFHEAHFKGKLSARKVLPEVPIDLIDDILSPCAIQIRMRKWEKFTAPLQAVGHNLVKEFYANAWEPDKAKKEAIHIHNNGARDRYQLCSKGHQKGAEIEEKRVGTSQRWKTSLLKEECPRAHGQSSSTRQTCHLASPSQASLQPSVWMQKVTTLKDDTLINQELPIAGEALIRTREGRARNPRQEAPPPQQPPQVHPQPQVHQQQEIPPNFYTHFDASMSQIYR
ncbi:hypothetical protein PIB30_073947, partial [Stylosanthes scabra]|nr:hypothetical protein [Stylosanthes scabra]